MGNLERILELFGQQNLEVDLLAFVVNIVLAVILSTIIGRIYVRFGESLSNRRSFGRNFVLLTVTTLLVITIVKSSLALSLGLVGALSIVRFRAAIKEPEELSYLFLCIGIGLGLGADQRVVTLVAFFCITLLIVVRGYLRKAEQQQNLLLTVAGVGADMERVIGIVQERCAAASLKRLDDARDMAEATFVVELSDVDELMGCKAELQKLNDGVRVTFLDNRGVI